MREGEEGLLIAEFDGSGGAHLLGLVRAEGPPPVGPTLLLPVAPRVADTSLMAYATEPDLGFDRLSREQVTGALAALPLEPTVLLISLLLSWVAECRADAAHQLVIAERVFGDAGVMDRFREWCKEPDRVLFSEQALVALVAQAFVHCQAGGAFRELAPGEEIRSKRLLLAAPGLLHDDLDGDDLGDPDTDGPERFLAYMTQNVLFNSVPNFGSSLARTWRMFGEMARDPDRAWKTPCDVDGLFDGMGMSLEQEMALAFALYAVLQRSPGAIAIKPETWRDACVKVAADRDPDELIECIARTPAEMREVLTGEDAQRFDPMLRWALVPLIEKPFVRLSDDRLLLISPRGIESWPADGVHYRLLMESRRRDRRNGVKRFTAFAGELTEASTIETIEDAHERAARELRAAGQVLGARPLREGSTDESTDLFVRDGDSVVVIEISSSRITAETRFTGDIDALQKDMEKLVTYRIEQLDRTVNAIRSNAFADMPNAEIKIIYPVIINVEPIRWSPMLHAYLREKIPGLLRQDGVEQPQFIDVEDIEALMSVIGRRSLPDLLAQKFAEAGPDADITQWVRQSNLAPRTDHPAIVRERLTRLFDAMHRTVDFDAGLAEAGEGAD